MGRRGAPFRGTGSQRQRRASLSLLSLFVIAILYKLKLGQSVTTIPTVGFNVETVSYKNVKFNVWVSHTTKQKKNLYYMNIFLLFRTSVGRIKFDHFGGTITRAPKVSYSSSIAPIGNESKKRDRNYIESSTIGKCATSLY